MKVRLYPRRIASEIQLVVKDNIHCHFMVRVHGRVTLDQELFRGTFIEMSQKVYM